MRSKLKLLLQLDFFWNVSFYDIKFILRNRLSYPFFLFSNLFIDISFFYFQIELYTRFQI